MNERRHMLSRAEKAAYVKGGGASCPYCGSDSVEAIEQVQMDGREGTQQIECKSCDALWCDVVRLVGVYETMEPDDPARPPVRCGGCDKPLALCMCVRVED